MKEVKYAKLVKEKLLKLKEILREEYGEQTAVKIVSGRIRDAENLGMFEKSGINIAEKYNMDTEYWYVFSNRHYLVYRIEKEAIVIVQMFHEREDFMMQLFGMSGRTQESIDYWGE